LPLWIKTRRYAAASDPIGKKNPQHSLVADHSWIDRVGDKVIRGQVEKIAVEEHLRPPVLNFIQYWRPEVLVGPRPQFFQPDPNGAKITRSIVVDSSVAERASVSLTTDLSTSCESLAASATRLILAPFQPDPFNE
jgi:hypothetical protein